MQVRRAFITGGAGFIGSRLAARMAQAGAEVAVYDNLHPQVHGPAGAPPAFPDGVRFVRGDVRDGPALSVALAQYDPDVVFHLAAETGTGQSYDQPSRYCAVNVDGACHLIEALRRLPERPRRFVLASSRAVYGEGSYRRADGSLVTPPARSPEAMRAGRYEPQDATGASLTPVATHESAPPQPASVYASTKLMQEHVCAQALEGAATDLVILRLQNVYGPGQSLTNPYTGVLSIFAAQALAGRSLEIYEDGRITRDFVFVDDVVDALGLAASCRHPGTGPINIGSGAASTIDQAARILLAALGADPERRWVSGAFRAGDVRHAVADIGRAQEALGWSPRIDLETGLRRLAQWAALQPALQLQRPDRAAV